MAGDSQSRWLTSLLKHNENRLLRDGYRVICFFNFYLWYDFAIYMYAWDHLDTTCCIWLLLASWDFYWKSDGVVDQDEAGERWEVGESRLKRDQKYGCFISSWSVLAQPTKSNAPKTTHVAHVCWCKYWDLGTLRNSTLLSGIPRNDVKLASPDPIV